MKIRETEGPGREGLGRKAFFLFLSSGFITASCNEKLTTTTSSHDDATRLDPGPALVPISTPLRTQGGQKTKNSWLRLRIEVEFLAHAPQRRKSLTIHDISLTFCFASHSSPGNGGSS